MDNENVYEIIVEELTKLYIKQFDEDKRTNNPIYVKKSEIYKDLLQWFKEYWSE